MNPSQKIVIIGGGFTGLTAAYFLTQRNFEVTVFEQENHLGGLASSLTRENWRWPLEKHYHHLFTNDREALDLVRKLGLTEKILILKPKTAVYVKGREYQLDSPISLLKFSLLPFFDRVRTGLVLAFLKLSPSLPFMKKTTADQFLKKWQGNFSYNLIFQPLFLAKFRDFAQNIVLSWFWARIKKRTSRLIYFQEGFDLITHALQEKIETQGGKILLRTKVQAIDKQNNNWLVKIENQPAILADKIIITTSTKAALKILPILNTETNLGKIKHLSALNLIIESKKPILKSTYWLNINEKHFPFLAVVQQTNFINKVNYGGNHICYICNYLPPTHEFFDYSPKKLLTIFWPFIQKINPNFNQRDVISLFKEKSAEAQPVVDREYLKCLPPVDLSNVSPSLTRIYLANMDEVYPWDRGVNYAISLGRKTAKLI